MNVNEAIKILDYQTDYYQRNGLVDDPHLIFKAVRVLIDAYESVKVELEHSEWLRSETASRLV